MNHVSQIIRLIEIAAEATKRSPHTVGRWVSGDGTTYRRLRDGRDITIRRAMRIMQRLSDLWPGAADWPIDIPRPAPTPDGVFPARAGMNRWRGGYRGFPTGVPRASGDEP